MGGDGQKEDFECTKVKFGCDFLWMKLIDGKNRWVPLRHVRWIGTTIDSKQDTHM